MSSLSSKEKKVASVRRFKPFGCTVMGTEPAWYQGLSTTFYDESHVAWREQLRSFVETELIPHADEWDEAGGYPLELHQRAAAAGVYSLIGKTHCCGKPVDQFHVLVMNDELGRVASGGLIAALFTAMAISAPIIAQWGTDAMKKHIVPEILAGRKLSALAVTEPSGGSDVANLHTTAVRDGRGNFVVNGAKKFITGGLYADYLVTAVRTGGAGAGGVSLLLIDGKSAGIRKTRIPTQGWWTSGTALLAFEDVVVPESNLIGQENAGFLPIMMNFNQERFAGICLAVRYMRICIEDSVAFARRRIIQGRPLIRADLVQAKLARMISLVEGIHAQSESLALDIESGAEPRQVGVRTALLKVAATQALEVCAREASQILGGASYQRTGPGARVERIYREVRVLAIGGGSEEALTLFAARGAKL